MKFVKFGAVLLAALTLTGCVESYTHEDVIATVAYKEYDPPSYKDKKVLNSEGEYITKKVYEPEEYEIVIQFEDISKEFEFVDNYLYDQVDIGDQIPMRLVLGLDAEGTIITTDMEFIE